MYLVAWLSFLRPLLLFLSFFLFSPHPWWFVPATWKSRKLYFFEAVIRFILAIFYLGSCELRVVFNVRFAYIECVNFLQYLSYIIIVIGLYIYISSRYHCYPIHSLYYLLPKIILSKLWPIYKKFIWIRSGESARNDFFICKVP